MPIDFLNIRLTQKEFGEVVGTSQQEVARLIASRTLPRAATFGETMLAYVAFLKGRRGRVSGSADSEAEDGLDLVQERAALAKQQRIEKELKNAVARGEYVQIERLAEIMGKGASAVADRLDQIEGAIRKIRPDIEEDMMIEILGVIASSRNEWVRATTELLDNVVDEMTEGTDEQESED